MRSTKAGAGRKVLNRHELKLPRGSLMFIEGERSTEMYIIRSGKVRILKQEGENTIELATLGPGSVLGELSLLDRRPRGATAQVVEDLTATIVDEALLQRTVENAPSWLSNVIHVVVKRLRDTMKKTSDDVVRRNVAGVIRILLLLIENEGAEREGHRIVYLSRAKEMIYAIIGLGGLEAENVFLHLILKDMAFVRKDELGREYLLVKEPSVLQMYLNYLRARQRGREIPGESLSEEATDLLATVVAAGEKNGRKHPNGLVRVGLQQVELESARRGKGEHIDRDALDELLSSKVIVRQDDVTQSKHGTHKRSVLLYNPDALSRLQVLKQWLPTFEEDIVF